MDELVSICIPTFRRPSLLLQCLHSCLIQDYRPLEIDISDNSPTDDSRDIVASVSPPEGLTIRYWQNRPSIDPISNQRKLFSLARGNRLVWMNDDDVLLPGAVTAMSEAFTMSSDVVLAYGIEQIIESSGEISPGLTARWNTEYRQFPEYTGLRRDLLVSAFWQQIPHVGFMVLTDVAQRVGIRDRSVVGLAADADFAIRLARLYRSAAYVFLNRATHQSRLMPTTLSRTSDDVCWKLYDIVRAIDDISPAERDARNCLLRRIGPLALREHALAGRRGAALRVLLSPQFRGGASTARIAYSAGLIAMPKPLLILRHLLTRNRDPARWLPPASDRVQAPMQRAPSGAFMPKELQANSSEKRHSRTQILAGGVGDISLR